MFLKKKNLPLAAQQQRLHDRSARWTLLAVGVGLVILISWAAIAEMPEYAKAPGQVIAVSRTQVIQASQGGELDDLLVHEGQQVKKDQLLARLSATRYRAALEESRSKVFALRASMARLKAEVFGGELHYGPEFKGWEAYVKNQTELFHRRRQALNDAVDALETVLSNVRDELRITEPLLKSGDVGKTDVLRLQRQEAELKGQIVNVRNKYFQDAQAEMTKTEELLASEEQVLTDRQSTLEKTEVRAPMDALVKRIVITTRGAAIRPSETIMELVPANDELVVEAKFSPVDVAYIKVGLPTHVKLDAYDFAIYGQALGEVIYISPDALSEPGPQGSERFFYRVRVKVTQLPEKLVRGKPITIQPGMTGQVDVQTANRTVLQYLAKPLLRGLSGSLTER